MPANAGRTTCARRSRTAGDGRVAVGVAADRGGQEDDVACPLHLRLAEARVGGERGRDATHPCLRLGVRDPVDDDPDGIGRRLREVALEGEEAALGDEAVGHRADAHLSDLHPEDGRRRRDEQRGGERETEHRPAEDAIDDGAPEAPLRIPPVERGADERDPPRR